MNMVKETTQMARLQCAVRTISRTNFYLWMYVAQEGLFGEAHEFVHEKLEESLPLEALLGIQPWIESDTTDLPFGPY